MPDTKTTNNEADAFRAFAKQVVSVPKAEIDRREKAYKEGRKGPRKAKTA